MKKLLLVALLVLPITACTPAQIAKIDNIINTIIGPPKPAPKPLPPPPVIVSSTSSGAYERRVMDETVKTLYPFTCRKTTSPTITIQRFITKTVVTEKYQMVEKITDRYSDGSTRERLEAIYSDGRIRRVVHPPEWSPQMAYVCDPGYYLETFKLEPLV